MQQKNPENTRLLYQLGIYASHPSDANYKAVLDELMQGNAYLLLSSVNEEDASDTWETTPEEQTLNLTCVFNLDGLKVLGAFTDEQAMLAWSGKATTYTGLRAQDVLQLCEEQGIDRIVINSHQKNMFVLERNRNNITQHTVTEDTKVLIGAPARPLEQAILDRLADGFRQVATIAEAYQYLQSMKGENTIVIGVVLTVVSDNARTALLNAVNTALQDVTLPQPLDIMVLNDAELLQAVQGIDGALFYKRD